jgi:hypothetical protein
MQRGGFLVSCITRLKGFLQELISSARFGAEEAELAKLLASRHAFLESGAPILVQVVEDFRFLGKFIFFLKAWRKHRGSFQINWVWILIPFRSNRSLPSYIKQEWIYQPLRKKKWLRLYQTLGGKLVYQSDHPPVLSENEIESEWGKIESINNLVAFEYEGILLGDLIYDTYLRYAHRPTLDLHDPFVKELFVWGLRLVRGYRGVFASTKYSLFLTSYTSYLAHGIPARIALSAGVPVYAMGAPNQLVVKPTLDFPYHKRNFHKYREWLAALPASDKEMAVRNGHEGIRNRLGGNKDQATFYMARSAYARDPALAVSQLLPPKSKPVILVIGHDFFDSPHIYGQMLYPDFYLWLSAIAEGLATEDCEILLKPHPNGIAGNREIYEELKGKYPHLTILPARVSSLELAERGVDLVLTVYGTVAHELAYIGLPVLCSGENPHTSFSFSTTTLSEQSFLEYLRNPTAVPRPAAESDEIAAFYSVHNWRTTHGEMSHFPFNVSGPDLLNWLSPKDPNFETRVRICEESLLRVDSL